jgi:hypothetical protein
MIAANLGGHPSYLLLGAVRGLVRDAEEVGAALDRYHPEAVGLAVSQEELKSLVEYFGDVGAEPTVPLSTSEVNEVRGLVRFGEVAVPNPSVLASIRWGRSHAAPVAPLDPSDEGAASLFTEHIGYVELVRRTVRENRLGRAPPTPSSADEFALLWDRQLAPGRGSRRYTQARNEHLVQEARRLGESRDRVALVVDRERFDGIRSTFDAGPSGSR